MQDNIFMARIWGGVHFRNSNEIGQALGAKVGAYVLATACSTLPRNGHYSLPGSDR
jgi:hypothetical protein